MGEREKWYNEILAQGFCFKDDKAFDKFLEDIEKLSKQHNTPEINYYHALRKKLKQIEGNKLVPVIGAADVKVEYTEERRKGSTKQYKISKITVSYIEKLKDHDNSRYS